MKKKLFTILFMMLSLFTLTSCVTTVEAQDGVYTTSVINVDDIEMAITYGTPYIINDVVQYYLYNNLYYYPFYTNGNWYYRVYTRPLIRYPHYWRPVPRSYWFRNGRYYNPHRFVGHHRYGNRPIPNVRRHHPNVREHHPNIRNHRESSTRQSFPSNNRSFDNRNITPRRDSHSNRVFRGGNHSSGRGDGHFRGRR